MSAIEIEFEIESESESERERVVRVHRVLVIEWPEDDVWVIQDHQNDAFQRKEKKEIEGGERILFERLRNTQRDLFVLPKDCCPIERGSCIVERSRMIVPTIFQDS